jgi:hypothetical protein
MSDTPLGHPLTEPERQSFQRLGLTPGHWAALAPAPLFYRPGTRFPNRRTMVDLEATDRLRRALRTHEGLSEEAGTLWDRLGDGTRRPEAALATRLLAWHLATDVLFVRRIEFFRLLRLGAEHFAAPVPHALRQPDPVPLFRALVDRYLPVRTFDPSIDPPRTSVSPPAGSTLDTLVNTIQTPLVTGWPNVDPLDVPRLMPNLVRVLGEPVREWWGQLDPARRAAERGIAGLSFEGREHIYTIVYGEWMRALIPAQPLPVAREQAGRLVDRMQEWADAVRFAARVLTPVPAAPDASAIDVAAAQVAGVPVEPHEAPPPILPGVRIIPAEFVQLPPSIREVPPTPPVPKPLPKPKPERVTVTVAEPFTTVPFADALARARAVSVADVCRWIDSNPRLLFDDCRDEASRGVAVVKTENAVPPDLWIIGDLHADLLALANILAFAESRAAPDHPAHFLFLGDFVDRGLHDHEMLLLLFRLLMDHSDRVCVVPGNHDVDLQFNESTGRFKVTIEPAEYCSQLNAAIASGASDAAERTELARAFIRFCAARPRAVFLPDGTLVAHGGFPHTDVQKDIAALADLCRPRCQDDFLWARIAETARVKRPNRGSRGHEFGWDTLVQFAKVAREQLDLPVLRLVRGHDHVPDRWQEYPEYSANGLPVLTLNAMGRVLDGDPPRRDGKRHPMPAVGRLAPDHLPEVFLLPLDPGEVDRAFAPPASGGELLGPLRELTDGIGRGGHGTEGAL